MIVVGKMIILILIGKFKIINKDIIFLVVFGFLWMGLLKFIYGIYGINDLVFIGRDMLYGCVRMDNEDILEFFFVVFIGMLVYIYK